MIDLILRTIVLVAARIAMPQAFGVMGFGGVLVLWFLMSWFYGGIFEACWNGQTPGKRLLHLRVLTIDGQPINGLQAVLRNIIKDLDMQPGYLCLVGLISTAMNHRFQRLGDLVAGTMVVYEKQSRLQTLTRVDDVNTAALLEHIPHGFPVGRSMARALAAYVQKRKQFSTARRAELAWHLAGPLCKQLELPRDTNPDLLLCALYQSTFVTDRQPSLPTQEPVA